VCDLAEETVTLGSKQELHAVAGGIHRGGRSGQSLQEEEKDQTRQFLARSRECVLKHAQSRLQTTLQVASRVLPRLRSPRGAFTASELDIRIPTSSICSGDRSLSSYITSARLSRPRSSHWESHGGARYTSLLAVNTRSKCRCRS